MRSRRASAMVKNLKTRLCPQMSRVLCRKKMGTTLRTQRGVKLWGLNARFQDFERHDDVGLATNKALRHDRERHHDLTQVWGPHKEVKPLLLPSCIALRSLAMYNKVWLHDASLKKKQPYLGVSNLARGS
jgi:hypothetical protein